MNFGVAYYPSLYDRNQIAKDAETMKNLGISLIRTGDLTWHSMEPKDGEIDLSLYEYTVRTMSEYGISTMLATPTAALPKWLVDKYPNIMMQMPNGERKRFGKRRHACINNEIYRSYVARITNHLAHQFANNPHVVAFQIDNELMAEEPYCYCDTCRNKFQTYLKGKYASIHALNQLWCNNFWSQTYNNFSEIELPIIGDNPAALTEYYSFFSDCATQFYGLQADIIKSKNNYMKVSTNICSSGFLYRWDLYNLALKEDFACIDNYPYSWTLEEEYLSYSERKDFTYNPSMAGFALSQTRALLPKPFWIAEAQVGRTVGKQCKIVEPSRVRNWTIQEWVHGAESVIYFAFRRFKNAQEHSMSCIMDYDDTLGPKWYEIKKTIADINYINSHLSDWRVMAHVAVVRDFNQDFAFEDKRFSADFRYMRHVYQYYDALQKEGITTDIVSLSGDFNKYKIVVVPSCAKLSDEQINKLKSYVLNGGKLIITAMTGIRDEFMNARNGFIAKPLEEMAGIKIIDSYSLMGGKSIDASIDGESLSCGYWFDWIKAGTANVLGDYRDGHFSGTPCITHNKYGEGDIYYLTTIFDQKSLQIAINRILSYSGIKRQYSYQSPLLEVIEGVSRNKHFIFALNHNYNEEVYLDLFTIVKDVKTNEKLTGKIIIPKMDYRILEKL